MIRDASADDLPALRALFARANDAPYDLSRVAAEKCFGHGLSGPPVVRVFERDGAIRGVAVRSGKYLRILAVAREMRGRGIGSALLDDVQGVIMVAAEAGNYFTPGVPMQDERTRAFFRARGFEEGAVTWNLEVGPDDSLSVDGVRRPAREESERVLEFVGREFGRIWRFEAAAAFERELPPAFISEEAGEITGFAVHDVNNRGLGFFGPTGVSRTMRGRGLGGALLRASLADLRRLGFSRVVIPWTDALDFYRKACGATPAHRFVAMQRV